MKDDGFERDHNIDLPEQSQALTRVGGINVLPPTAEKHEDNMDSHVFAIRPQGIAGGDLLAISEQLLQEEERDYDWGQVFSAAPRTLVSIGCFVAAAWLENGVNIVQERDESLYVSYRLVSGRQS